MTAVNDFRWSGAEVLEALGGAGGALVSAGGEGGEEVVFSAVSTDTRTLAGGELFVALSGERFDAHAFLGEAVAAGAAGVVVSTDAERTFGPPPAGVAVYRVPDTLEALGLLARHRRRALAGKVIAVTGSAGKTAVKELLAGALGVAGSVHRTQGNLNNRVGLPLTLLAAPATASWVVVEIGTSLPGEIRTLTAICEPDAGVLTTVSEAHLEGLGTLEGVLEEKLDLVRGVGAGGVTVVGDLPPVLPARARALRPGCLVAGSTPAADPEARSEVVGGPDREGRYLLRMEDTAFRSPLPGRHGAQNATLALATARALGVPVGEGVHGLASITPDPLRGELRPLGSRTLLLDCYNANPQSTVAALELLAEIPAEGPRIAVLGSMLELGPEAGELHDRVLARAAELSLTRVVGMGLFEEGARRRGGSNRVFRGAPSLEEAAREVAEAAGEGAVILLKGSRGAAMERIVPLLEARLGTGRGEG